MSAGHRDETHTVNPPELITGESHGYSIQRRHQTRRSRFQTRLDTIYAQASARWSTQHPDRALRRYWPGRMVAIRRPHQYAYAATAGGWRTQVLAMAHHCALFPYTFHVSHRPQPSCESLRLHYRGRRWISRSRGTAPGGVRHHWPGASG